MPEDSSDSPFLFRRRKRAQAAFANRQAPVAEFEQALAKLQSEPAGEGGRANVLQFYGLGGIGKTRLLCELKKRLLQIMPAALIAEVDFDDESVRSPHRALLRLRKSARGRRKIDFRHFDLAYMILFAKRNPDFSFEKGKLPFLEEAGVFGDIVGAFDGLGLAGAVTGILEQIQRVLEKFSIKGEPKEALAELRVMSEREVEEALPEFLAYDLARQAHRHGPVVLFFDTYEQLWESHTAERVAYLRDNWVRRLALCSPGALFVVAGRERIRWDEFEGGWDASLDRTPLDRLAPKDSREFLISAGVTDEALVERMVEVSEGHPYHLDLCVDAFIEGRLQGIETTATAWPDTKRELFERFVRSIGEDELALLRCLAPLASYGFDYARSATRHFGIPMSDERLMAHFRFSFVKQHETEATIHEIMRRSILANTSPKRLREVREFAVEFFSQKLYSADSDADDEQLSRSLREASSQLRALDDDARMDAWLAGPAKRAIRVLQQRAAAAPVLETLSLVRTARLPRFWPDELRTAFADMTHLVGQYREAIRLLDEHLAHRTEEEILADDELSFALVRRLHHRMMVDPLSEVWAASVELVHRLEAKGRKLALLEGLFLLGGNLGAACGDRAKAAPWLAKAVRTARAERDHQMMTRCLRKLSDFARMAGNLDSALAAANRGLALAEKLHLRRYALYLICILGDVYRLRGESSAAEEAFRTAREGFASANMEGWLGHSYLGEGVTAIDRGDLPLGESALAAAERYYQRTEHAWGVTQIKLQRLRASRLNGSTEEELKDHAERLASRARSLGYQRDVTLARQFVTFAPSNCPAVVFL